MKFQIQQVAICPKDPVAAQKLLEEMGANDWISDHVTATGQVFGVPPRTNEANLEFNYQLLAGNEFEILHYTDGLNWMQRLGRANSVSHFGMHCTEEDLPLWRKFFAERNIRVAQEVVTDNHTNPSIAGKRRYNYVIFDTKDILGVDLKFIVRIDVEE